MKTFLNKKIKDLTPGELYCYKLDKRHRRGEKICKLTQGLFHFVDKLCDLFALLGQRIGLIYEKAASRSTARFSAQPVANSELMVAENFEEQLVLAPKLARLFANDKEFAHLIGLSNHPPTERASLLEPRIGFILAMYRAMKTISRQHPYLSLDDKFAMLIHSRISIIPEVIQDHSDIEAYAKQCYIEAKRNADGLGMKWNDMSLKEKFFEVCLRTEFEEEKLLLMDPTDTEDEFWKVGHRNIFTLLFEKTFESVDWEIANSVGRLSHEEDAEVEQLDEVNVLLQGETLEHPFFEDYVEAVQSYSGKTFGKKGRDKLRQVYCTIYPALIIETHWDGWQLGIPRPKDLMPEEAFNLFYGEATVFLRQFFKRVENDNLYCDWSHVISKFGEENVASRMAGKTGLLYNLERVYWTFNVKFNKWICQNTENYGCSLVCDLDEIVARADSILREAFFPTPGPIYIGPKTRKEYQLKVLREAAPNLEKPLIEQIWH